MAVALNAEYVPPHESGCGLYIRPLLFGSSPMFIPGSPDQCTFCVYVFPTSVGMHPIPPVKALVLDDFDRTAPKGVGHAKVGGNYAGVVRWTGAAKAQGFGITLHLDSAKHEDVDEFSTCGFLGILYTQDTPNDVTIVVPDSPCVIESVTSDSIQQIGRSWGWKVEKRPIHYMELPVFSEILGAGTAVGLVAIRSITRMGKKSREVLSPLAQVVSDAADLETVVYIKDDETAGGPVFSRLTTELRAIQQGKVADNFGWRCEVRAEDKPVEACGKIVTLSPVPVI
ncbi:hypothetical protein ONS95_014145 [Cadophora gregata]|uniref:uncharacterized protein n=1 Tax=Cadophora gregata TaxID=51156 RepID=UPI0026DBE80D|nr:uncharacterized protein ONS95_014145 [Cadophora gregata]KAK0114660.1 hypothetical protein ONS95_014145 [Cadophora gregata]